MLREAPKDYESLYTHPEYQKIVKRIFYSTMGSNPSRGRDFEEALAEVTLHLIKRDILGKYNPDKGLFGPYLWSSVRNFFIRYSKKAQKCPTDLAVGLDILDVDNMFGTPQYKKAMEACVLLDQTIALVEKKSFSLRVKDHGPATLADVIRLAFEGYTNTEIAEYFRVSKTSVAYWWKRIAQIMQESTVTAV